MLITVNVLVEQEKASTDDVDLEGIDLELEGAQQTSLNDSDVEKEFKPTSIDSDNVLMIQETYDNKHSIIFLKEIMMSGGQGGTAVLIVEKNRRQLQKFINQKKKAEAQWSE